MPLRESITKNVLLLLTINSVIGTGIFFLPSVAAGIAGPASLLSWGLISIVAILISMYFAELVSLFPKSGGVYEYTKNAFGELPGFLTGWTAWIVSNITIAMLIIGGLEYFSAIYPLSIVQRIVIALIFVLGMNIINYRGIDMSVKTLLVFSLITISLLWLLISWGSFQVDIANFTPFFTFPKFTILVAMFFIMETFFGWETTTFLAEETKNPRKTIPKVLVLATIIVTILTLLLVFVSLGITPWYSFAFSNAPTYGSYLEANSQGFLVNQKAPLSYMVSKITSPRIMNILGVFIFLNIIGAAAAWIISTPRLIFAIARDRLLPGPLAKVHPTHGTPHNAIILQTLLTSMIILSGSYLFLLEVLLPLAVLMYAAVLLSVTALHIKNKKLKPDFKAPLPKIVPVLIAIFLVILMVMNTDPKTLLISLAFAAIGIPLYITSIMGYNKKIIKASHNLLTPFIFVFTKITIKKSVLKNMTKYMKNQLKVMDLGCGVGVSTFSLAKAMPLADIIGVDFSSFELSMAKRMQKFKQLSNIKFINHDVTELKRHKILNKELRRMDGAVSIAILGYLDDPLKFMKDLNKRLKKGAKIYFVEYDYLSQIWEKPWVESDRWIKEMFKTAGFKVHIRRQKTLFWKYVEIYGTKK